MPKVPNTFKHTFWPGSRGHTLALRSPGVTLEQQGRGEPANRLCGFSLCRTEGREVTSRDGKSDGPGLRCGAIGWSWVPQKPFGALNLQTADRPQGISRFSIWMPFPNRHCCYVSNPGLYVFFRNGLPSCHLVMICGFNGPALVTPLQWKLAFIDVLAGDLCARRLVD